MRNQALTRLFHCTFSLNYELVIMTHAQRQCLTSDILRSLEAQARERCRAWGGELLSMVGEGDHMRLQVSLPPSVALADFVNALKTGTSRRLRNEFGPHLARFYSDTVLWARHYCAVTTGADSQSAISLYIQATRARKAQSQSPHDSAAASPST